MGPGYAACDCKDLRALILISGRVYMHLNFGAVLLRYILRRPSHSLEISSLLCLARLVGSPKKSRKPQKAANVLNADSAETSQHRFLETTQYVAGLWELHLASQLLWYVEPTFRHVDGSFEHLTMSPLGYRAPYFSWAAIDAERGNGIKYGEVTDRDRRITVEEISVTPLLASNESGML
jgi:hypothetical protein